ncbi:MAG: hypothetical protein M2R45_02799 [Verrucomicrobia subdivision 3 bacterium]|nr:hypothetical protein [Limisphaerales bacterium]MCS1414351.1 hypothetical protein [Limisphaerales bacterium]
MLDPPAPVGFLGGRSLGSRWLQRPAKTKNRGTGLQARLNQEKTPRAALAPAGFLRRLAGGVHSNGRSGADMEAIPMPQPASLPLR